ncbi:MULTISPECIES: hypoxanthine phosphoribosyltransferase [unclassified Lentimonas]|uniref:hypoxanthine phosphoribosyltransferase n=1 Tax=unclassified Lentimonas TaxID=2630993 RepID=UPI00132A6401|nr:MULTISPECIES: hypoxanthine phosphoribosyltransferase [unclassified Lentimonas]CAA6679174.1 Hypoxanthine-guanine phosphoribosyltransferase (EC [Lentimonas sp. CC4]CAA6684082.1 Hypoxanthine-guanine phosphoribosyltransferase (EC [Lentimonas sp. CC6]CAA6689786.1 Hypoxanthine-guanine phosphoribosyltransferase (EC [Lentimonas sp. CC10]CAA6694793.1 Hypoxanthine-guanine phosphoribosyltransferase (EC [Lentimonas sp. CC19]CAA7069496.1 Hypoxanthine-guanine phosphoribosyltransferase (EC [Lentimonas sp.
MGEQGLQKTLISKEEIAEIVAKLGSEITECYKDSDKELIVVGLLRGSFIFMADLVREIKCPMVTDFMTISSYGDDTISSGDVKVVMDLDESITDRDVLLVEDIIDTGNTFSKVIRMLEGRTPASLRICTLLNKPSRRKVEVPIDFCGIDIPDEFVCGYGLDYAQKFRNVPYIGIYEGPVE